MLCILDLGMTLRIAMNKPQNKTVMIVEDESDTGIFYIKKAI